MKITTLCLTLCITCITLAQQPSSFNVDFENISDKKPTQWNNYGNGDYKAIIDSTITQHGKYSASLESTKEGNGFWAWGLTIPVTFGGKKIKLTGYVKTENVADGYAGLWMRIDPEVGFDNMARRGIKGTTDWQPYEIELDLKPNEATNVIVGGLLAGKGKMWIDNLSVTIDGKTLDKAPKKVIPKAKKDTEFDSGSNFTISNPTTQQIKNLTVLGKVWGFLKYHHPAVATGEFNWDYELFRVVENIAFAKADSERDQYILTWIDSYGTIPECEKCKETHTEAYLKPDNKWILSSNISKSLQQRLSYIYANRYQGKKHYYIESAPQIGNPVFTNENPYTAMAYPDTGFRLLSLYRYWNMIHYYFPYKDVTDKDWNAVLEEYIPQFIEAKDELSYEIAALQIIGDIKDTHANIWRGDDKWEATKGDKFPPIHTRFIENNLVIVDFYNPEMKPTLGLELGDIIKAINGIATSQIVREKIPYYPASNSAARMRDISGDILKGNGEKHDLTIIRERKELQIEMPLFDRKDLDIYNWYPVPKESKSYKMLPGNIGYITLANITDEDPKAIAKEFINCAGIVIDIRNYPSAFMPFALGQFIAPEGTDFVKFTRANLKNPGEFTMGSTLKIGSGTIAKEKFKGKVIVLVNELSQSQAEYTAMAFRAAPNTTVVGSTTAGADGNVSPILLPGGLRTMISGIGIFYPDGSPTQRVGIVPDIEVKPTIKGIKEGKDELLERAIELIQDFKD